MLVKNPRPVNFRLQARGDQAISANNEFNDLILSVGRDKLVKYETLGSDAALGKNGTRNIYCGCFNASAPADENDAFEGFRDAIGWGSIRVTSVEIG